MFVFCFFIKYDFLRETHKINDFKAWIFTIANNLHRDELRKKKIRRLFFINKQMESDHCENSLACKNLEFRIAFQQAVAKLSHKQRHVFVLQEIAGFKQKEISKILNIPVGAVKSLFYCAIKFLQKELIEFQTN